MSNPLICDVLFVGLDLDTLGGFKFLQFRFSGHDAPSMSENSSKHKSTAVAVRVHVVITVSHVQLYLAVLSSAVSVQLCHDAGERGQECMH